jgi:hypothetical protein
VTGTVQDHIGRQALSIGQQHHDLVSVFFEGDDRRATAQRERAGFMQGA